jgi:hypothetical protein
MHVDNLSESQFYLYGVHEDNFSFSFCLPTAAMPRIFNALGLSVGSFSANISQVTRFLLSGRRQFQRLCGQSHPRFPIFTRVSNSGRNRDALGQYRYRLESAGRRIW